MAYNDPTTNYGWDLPTEDGDAGSWGNKLNEIFGNATTGIDAKLKAVSDVADAALPKAGGTMTGNLKVLTEEYTEVDKGSVSGALSLDCSAGNFFHLTTTGNITSVSLSNVPTGFFAFMVEITAGGSHSVTWGAAWKWPGGSAAAQTASGKDLYVAYTYDGGTTINISRAMEDLS
jgi:hypothetical protein